MNMDPEVLDMIAKVLGVNIVATLLLAVLSVAYSALMLNGLASLDRWLDPSRTERTGPAVPTEPDPHPPRRVT
jgi:hypothetical protein